MPAVFVLGDAPGLLLPAVDLRAGESVLVAGFLAGRPLARCGVPEGPALIADLVAICEGRARCAIRASGFIAGWVQDA